MEDKPICSIKDCEEVATVFSDTDDDVAFCDEHAAMLDAEWEAMREDMAD